MRMGTLGLLDVPDSSTPSLNPYSYNADKGYYYRTAAELQYRSRCFVEALNGRAFRQFNQIIGPEHIDSNFTAYLDNPALAFSWSEFVSTLCKATKADPEYYANIIKQSVDLDERAGRAVVFIIIEVTGRPKSVRREDALVFEWRKEGETWMCYEHTAIRGSSGIRLSDHG